MDVDSLELSSSLCDSFFFQEYKTYIYFFLYDLSQSMYTFEEIYKYLPIECLTKFGICVQSERFPFS